MFRYVAGFVVCEPLAFGTGAGGTLTEPVALGAITPDCSVVFPYVHGLVACEPLAFGTGAHVPVTPSWPGADCGLIGLASRTSPNAPGIGGGLGLVCAMALL